MKNMMKGIAAGFLMVAVVIAGQMALTGVVDFHTAEAGACKERLLIRAMGHFQQNLFGLFPCRI